MENILTRRSVRKFDTTKEVKKEDLIKIIEAGCQAPSAKNQQPWEFVIIDDKQIIEELSNSSKNATFLNNCTKAIALLGKDPTTLRIPHMVCQDLSACMQNMLLMARALELGSCWISVYPVEERMQAMKKALNLPEGILAFSLMAVGHCSLDEFKQEDRFSEERMHYNRY